MIRTIRIHRLARQDWELWQTLYYPPLAALPPPARPTAKALSPTRKKILRHVLLHKSPADYGIDSQQWTVPLVRQWLRRKWQVSLVNTRLYDIFGELSLSHQKARHDFGPGRPASRDQAGRQIGEER